MDTSVYWTSRKVLLGINRIVEAVTATLVLRHMCRRKCPGKVFRVYYELSRRRYNLRIPFLKNIRVFLQAVCLSQFNLYQRGFVFFPLIYLLN